MLLLMLLLLLLMPTGRLSEPAAAINNARLLPGRTRQEGHSPVLLSGLALYPAWSPFSCQSLYFSLLFTPVVFVLLYLCLQSFLLSPAL